MQYWLLKTEPHTYSIDDLKREKVGVWDGVRNYQARNYLRTMKKGDVVLIYHSSTALVGVVGLGCVVKEAYPDPKQFDKHSAYFDPKSTQSAPRWDAVSVRFTEKFPRIVTLHELKLDSWFNDMLVVKRGVRLSVQPVAEKYAERIREMAHTSYV